MRFAEFQNTDKDLESALVNTLTNMRGDANDDKEVSRCRHRLQHGWENRKHT